MDATGACLLIDPTTEDPADRLELLLGSGEYTAVDGSPRARPLSAFSASTAMTS